MFGDIIHKIRNGLDDVGSFLTGEPAHGPAAPQMQITHPAIATPQSPTMGQPRLNAPANPLMRSDFTPPTNNQFKVNPISSSPLLHGVQDTQPHSLLPVDATSITRDSNGNVIGYENPLTHQDVQTVAHNPQPAGSKGWDFGRVFHDVTHNPVTNTVGNMIVKPVIQTGERTFNTVGALGAGVGGLARIGVDAATNNPGAERNAIAQTQEAIAHRLAPGKAFMTLNQAQNADLFGNAQQRADLIHPIVNASAQIAPYVIGPEAGALSEGASLPLRMATQAGVWGSVGAGGTAAQEWANNQKLNAAQIIKGGTQNALIGSVAEGLSDVASKANDAIKSNAPKVAQSLHSAIQKLPTPIRDATVETAASNKPITTLPANSLTPTDISGYGELDPQRVEFYKQQYQQGAPVDPILAMQGNDGNLYVEDGKHRLAALQSLGAQSIPTKIVTPADIHAIAQGGYAKLPGVGEESNGAEGASQGVGSALPESPEQMLESTQQQPSQGLRLSPMQDQQVNSEDPLQFENSTKNGIRLAQGNKKGPDVNTFVRRVEKQSPYGDDLESNIQKLLGHYKANRIALKNILKGNKRLNPADLEAVYHHAEDPTTKLSARQQTIFDKYYMPLKDAQSRATSELSGKEANSADTYIHRIAKNKGSNLEAYLDGRRQSPEEGVNRKTIDSSKMRNMMAIVDPKTGERHIVNIDTPEDELGKAKGAKRVTAIDNGVEKDLGVLKKNLPTPVREAYDPVVRQQLEDVAKGLGIKHERMVRLGGQRFGESATGAKLIRTAATSPEDTLLHEIGHQIDEKYNLQEKFVKDPELKQEMRNLTDLRKGEGDSASYGKYIRKGEEKIASMFQAYMRNPELFKEVAPKTFTKFTDFLASHKDTEPILKIEKTLQKTWGTVGDELSPGQFIDKNGRTWKLENATTKEIEANTNVRYYKEPLLNTALNVVNSRNAIAAKQFMEHWQLSPDFAQHAIKSDGGHIPDNWEAVNSPAFRGYYFDPKTAKLLNTYFGSDAHDANAIAKVWNGASNIATQAIVINPEVHGLNLYTQGLIKSGNIKVGGDIPIIKDMPLGPLGMLKFNRSLVRMRSAAFRAETLDDYLRNGGHFMSYGKDQETAISRALQKAHLPGINKLNSDAMAGIDATIRAALWDSAKDSGESPQTIVADIDRFLGRQGNEGELLHGITLFYHWIKTQGIALGSQMRHPIKNAGANLNTIGVMAALYGVNAVWQKVTGNKYAHVRIPGELSLAHDIYDIPSQLAQGQVPSVITSHINPIANAIINQAAGKDLYSGAPVLTASEREHEAVQNLFSPSQNISKIANGKSTIEEQLANEMGLYTPHVKGTMGAPNFANQGSLLSNYNTAGATPNTNQAYTDTQQYYNSLNKLNASLEGPNQAQDFDTAQKFIQRDKTPQGLTIELSPPETANNWGSVANNPSVLSALQKFYQGTSNHNPEWDLTGTGVINGQNIPKLQVWAVYKSYMPGDVQRDAIAQQNPWINTTENQVQSWAQQQNFSKNVVQGAGYIPYPNIPSAVQNWMNQANQISQIPAAQRTPLQTATLNAIETDPSVQQAYNLLDSYTNAVRRSANRPETISNTSTDGGIGTITSLAQTYGLDPQAVLSVASMEGLDGKIGDNGTSFGPFQLHAGGLLPQSVWQQGPEAAQAWAWSPQGIEYAIASMAQVAKGQKGEQAIQSIVNNFEQPLNPSNEIYGATQYYNDPNAIKQVAANSNSVLSPVVQQFMSEYMAASKTARNTMRTSNPQLYNEMQQAMEQQSLTSAAKYGGEAYYGAIPPNSYLSDMYNLGAYDIAKIPNANGTNSYGLVDFTGQPLNSGLSQVGAGDANLTSSGAGRTRLQQETFDRDLSHSLRYASPRNVRLSHYEKYRKPYIKNIKHGIKSSVPQGKYTSVPVTKGTAKVKNIRVAGVKQYKPVV